MLGLGLALLSGALKIGGELAAHSAQKKAAKANAASALDAYGLQLQDIGAREQQEREAAAQAVAIARKEALSSSSTTKAAAGEAGVEGGSVDALINEIVRAQGEAITTLEQNLDMTEDQLKRQRRGAKGDYIARVNAVQPPNLFATGLRIAGSALPRVSSIAANSPTTSTVRSTTGRNPNAVPGQ